MRKAELVLGLRPVPRTTSLKALMSVSSSLFEAVDSPKSLAAHLLLKYGEYAQLVNLSIRPDDYLSAERFADDYLVSKFLSKFQDFIHEDLDPKGKAMESFLKYEEACKATNVKFKKLDADPSLWDPVMLQYLLLARRKIASVLGEPNLNRIASLMDWGPGATTSASGNHTSAYVKFQSRLDVTSNTLVMGKCCVNSIPSWVNCQLQTDEFPGVRASVLPSAFNIVRGNEIVFVPKNAKTHRIIAKEPHVNSYLQKGFGAYIRERLRTRAGVDLKDQTRNQRLAKEGSLTGLLSTIDLSGASDTISTELVKFLLPEKWFSLLSCIRSGQGYLREEGVWIHYHKFSSMGNACTFELESLIFWALCKSVLLINKGEQTLNVYGDDLVVPTEHYENVAKVINFVGFEVNSEKSFFSGHFRESCGKDYFNGIDVRPIFLKETISNVESLFKLANSIRRYSHRRHNSDGCDRRFRTAWQCCFDRLPGTFRGFQIPDGFGDIGLISNFDEACPFLLPKRRNETGWGGYVFRGVIRKPVKQEMRDRHAGYTATLSGIAGDQQDQVKWSTGDSVLYEDRSQARAPYGDPNLVDFLDRKLVNAGQPLLGSHDLRKMTHPTVGRIHTHGWYELGPWK